MVISDILGGFLVNIDKIFDIPHVDVSKTLKTAQKEADIGKITNRRNL